MAKQKYTLNDTYKNYYLDHKEESKYMIDKKLFKEIAKLLFTKISEEIIYKGTELKFPNRFGSFYIKKFKPSNPGKNIDFKKTNELYGEWNKANPNNKKVVLHKNRHSEGYSARWFWNKINAKVTNKSLFRFKPTRFNSRLLSSSIKEKNTIQYYAS